MRKFELLIATALVVLPVAPIVAQTGGATSAENTAPTNGPGQEATTTDPNTVNSFSPGDIIITGTPTGAGARFDRPRYLKPGDVVEVEVEGIGTLRNGVEDEVTS